MGSWLAEGKWAEFSLVEVKRKLGELRTHSLSGLFFQLFCSPPLSLLICLCAGKNMCLADFLLSLSLSLTLSCALSLSLLFLLYLSVCVTVSVSPFCLLDRIQIRQNMRSFLPEEKKRKKENHSSCPPPLSPLLPGLILLSLLLPP